MALHYLTFMGKSLENKKKLMPKWIMNNVGLNAINIVDNVSIFSDSAIMNSILSV